MKHTILGISVLVWAVAAKAQEVKGTVKDQDGKPVAGATISVEESFSAGAVTSADGTYRLQLPAAGSFTLHLRAMGYQPSAKPVQLSGKETLSADWSLQPSINDLKEITVTAGRKAEIVDRTPASVQVVNEKEIQRQMLVSANINNVLAQSVPSLGMGTNTTSNTGQTLRGRSPLILIDGIPQSTPLRAGGRDMRTIDPAVIERIEVVKGATAIYGNGADGGIINYITKKPVKGKNLSAATYLTTTGMPVHSSETFGGRLTQQFSGNLKSLDYVVNGTYEKTGVYKDANGQVLTPVYGLGETTIQNLFGKIGYNFGASHRVEAMYNYFGSKQNSGYIEQMGVYGSTPTIGVAGKSLGVDEGTRYNHNAYVKYLAKDLFWNTNLDASAYLQSFKTVYGYSTYFQNGGQSTIESKKKGIRLNLQTPYAFSTWLNGDVVYGVDVLHDVTSQKLTDGRTWVPEINMKNTAPYLQATANVFRDLIFKAGFRFDAVNITVPDFTQIIDSRGTGGQQITGGEVNFQASTFNTGLRLAKWEALKPFISYTQGFSVIDVGRFVRAAKENELAKMQIEPVVVNNYEAGFSSSLKWLAFTGSYFISTNKIGASLVEENGWYVQQKAPEKTYGFEAALDATPIPQLRTGISYVFTEGKADINRNDQFNDAEDRYLTGLKIPPPKTSAYVRYMPSGSVDLMLQWIYYGDRQRFAPRANGTYAYGEGPVDGNSVVNLTGAWEVNRKLSLNLGIENLLNNDYFMPQAQWSAQNGDYIKANGIRYQLGVALRW